MRSALVVFGVVLGSACNGGMTAPTMPVPVQSGPAFTIDGAVYDTIGRPLAQARVEVVSGTARGTAVLTDDSGRYSLTMSSPSEMRASKAGYHDQTLPISISQGTRWFRLESVNGSADLGGLLTMTFAADSACTAIPGYARRQTYDAISRGAARMYLITLSGGGYNLSGRGYFSNVLYTGVFEDTAQINLSDPPIWQRFPQGSYLVIYGQAQGSVGVLPATLPLDAEFTYCAEMLPGDEPKCAVTEVTCRSSNHRLTVAAQ